MIFYLSMNKMSGCLPKANSLQNIGLVFFKKHMLKCMEVITRSYKENPIKFLLNLQVASHMKYQFNNINQIYMVYGIKS